LSVLRPPGARARTEFFQLAGVWLECRWKELHAPGDKIWFLLGEMDYEAEMGLLLKEFASGTSAADSRAAIKA
jgi:hypothetical protein